MRVLNTLIIFTVESFVFCDSNGCFCDQFSTLASLGAVFTLYLVCSIDEYSLSTQSTSRKQYRDNARRTNWSHFFWRSCTDERSFYQSTVFNRMIQRVCGEAALFGWRFNGLPTQICQATEATTSYCFRSHICGDGVFAGVKSERQGREESGLIELAVNETELKTKGWKFEFLVSLFVCFPFPSYFHAKHCGWIHYRSLFVALQQTNKVSSLHHSD